MRSIHLRVGWLSGAWKQKTTLVELETSSSPKIKCQCSSQQDVKCAVRTIQSEDHSLCKTLLPSLVLRYNTIRRNSSCESYMATHLRPVASRTPAMPDPNHSPKGARVWIGLKRQGKSAHSIYLYPWSVRQVHDMNLGPTLEMQDCVWFEGAGSLK